VKVKKDKPKKIKLLLVDDHPIVLTASRPISPSSPTLKSSAKHQRTGGLQGRSLSRT
jgi:hypothetical protein